MIARTTLLILFVAAGCRSADDQVVGKPPEAAAIAEQPTSQAPSPAQASRPRMPDPRLSIAGWPYQENNNTFELRWRGGSRAVPLHAEPDPNSRLLGEVEWNANERILWRDTVVAVYAPRVLRADTDGWLIEGPIYTEGYLTQEQFTEVSLNRGGRIEVWAYGGDGICYLSGVGKLEIFTAPCPSSEHFKGLGEGRTNGELYGPERLTWWIQITGDNISGWVPVDDRMTVKVVTN